ncbi:hypothetical protein B0J17DRAFT_246514 [Rhizoctonia solani]|nr:hypothetical protein B0J17DRAFT_246514 [Rhizoctonia solani]
MAFGDPPSSLVTALVGRLSISDTTFSVMTLGAKIIQSMLDAIDRTNWMAYEKPIDSLHWLACNMPEEGSSLVCTKGRLIAAIEVYHTVSVINTLANLIPAYYLQVLRIQQRIGILFLKEGGAFADSCCRTLSPNLDGTRQDLDTENIEPRRYGPLFLSLDGYHELDIPRAAPLIRYNTSVQGKSGLSHPIEWLNGCPREFICWFAMFNEIRSTTTRYEGGSLLIDWEVVEKEIQEWESVIDRTNLSRNNITRLAARRAGGTLS